MLPMIQLKTYFFELEPLRGAIEKTEPVPLNAANWFSGKYQETKEKIYGEQFGFRSAFIRINNQIDYDCFSKINAQYVIVGKNNYLYEETYINALYGRDFVGEDSIRIRLTKLKFVQDELKKRNKTLLVVLAPSKASYFPEYIPDNLKSQKTPTNRRYFTDYLKELEIHTIDFNDYFVKQKKETKYPLFGQYGVHWSTYGAALATDSIIRFLEKERKIDMPNLYWNKVEWSYPSSDDQDLLAGMNLLKKYQTFSMAYPKLLFTKGKTKPGMIMIADSFYWLIYGFRMNKVFSKDDFWYYNHDVFSYNRKGFTTTSALNLKDEINNHDVFVIMCTDANLPRFGWGAVEQFYDYFRNQK
jgi:hypothetical protein